MVAAIASALAISAGVLARLKAPSDPTRPLAKLKASDLSKIELSRSGQDIILEKGSGAWRLSAPVQDAAESERVEGLAQSLLSLTLGTEVSQDPAGYPDYGLDEQAAARVRIYAGSDAAPRLDGYFGKKAIGSSVYFRRNREPAVYLAEGVATDKLPRSAEELRSHSLISLSLSDLQDLRIAQGSSSFRIEKSSGQWAASGRALSADQAAELVLAATSLRFAAFATPEYAKNAGLDKPALTLTASGGNRTERVLLGKAVGDRRWAKVESRSAIGYVSKSDADALLKLIQ